MADFILGLGFCLGNDYSIFRAPDYDSCNLIQLLTERLCYVIFMNLQLSSNSLIKNSKLLSSV